MPLPATSLYAALLAVLVVLLSLRVIRLRQRYHILLGTPHRLVERAVRAHGNCVEYGPLGLVLLGLLEGMGLPLWGVHALGTALLAGRVLHAFGISREPEAMRWRVAGMALTFAVLGLGGAALLGLVLADAAERL
ncbi:MAPEG family protein [Roseicella frigidaeris]|uniref:Glutathione metabolism protein n=1 Tax=Roseicella frigidaeris TaxID=2230885 RepID=A0A327M2Q9_9PROT|nr:MAPEG family protein [Roseicella frigidaeris]RAI57571.1 glutathione metabolism protein [Roseicella frigidaeris]